MSTTRVVKCVEHDRVAMPLQGRFWCPVSPAAFHPVDKNGERVTEPTRPRNQSAVEHLVLTEHP